MTTLQDLRLAYDRANRENRREFEHEGTVFVTGYIKYLLEYCNQRRFSEDVEICWRSGEGDDN